jgi:hypothetical protein
MIMTKPYWLTAVLAFACVAVPAQAQNKLSFKWKFTQGEKFVQETRTTLKQTIRSVGMEQKQDMDQVLTSTYEVLDVTAEAIKIRLTLDDVKANVTGAGSNLTNIIQQLRGLALILTLDAKHNVTQVEGYEDLMKRVAGENEATKRMVKDILSEDALKKSLKEALAFGPADPVGPGEKWTREASISLGPLGTLLTTNHYTFEGTTMLEDKPVAKVLIDQTVKYEPPKGDGSGLPFQIVKSDLKAENAKGTLWFAIEQGKPVRLEQRMRYRGTMTISANGMNVDMEIDQDQNVVINYTKKD